MKTITCRNCESDETVVANETNFADAYYCHNCNQPFNPAEWPCPWCDTAEPVSLNPFDDPAEYYCYECDLAFNRLGATFTPSEVEDGSLEEGFETSDKRLSLDFREKTERPPRIFEFTLQNTGSEPVLVQGRTACAVQKYVTDGDWWTIHGNPEGHIPKERFELAPDETLAWECLFSRGAIEGPEFEINQRFTSGTYRVVYWGVPAAETVLVTHFDLELRSWDAPVG